MSLHAFFSRRKSMFPLSTSFSFFLSSMHFDRFAFLSSMQLGCGQWAGPIIVIIPCFASFSVGPEHLIDDLDQG